MERRRFLARLLGAGAGVLLDPEAISKLLWTRQKTIFLPPVLPELTIDQLYGGSISLRLIREYQVDFEREVISRLDSAFSTGKVDFTSTVTDVIVTGYDAENMDKFIRASFKIPKKPSNYI